MKNILITFLVLVGTMTTLKAHIHFNPSKAIQKQHSHLSFWTEKAEANPMSHDIQIKLATINTKLFELTGIKDYLLQAEEHLSFTTNVNSLSRSIGLCLLAQNLITQHKFCQAYDTILEAAALGRNLESVHLIQFDIEYELGYDTRSILSGIENKTDIEYLIRLAKQYKKDGAYRYAIRIMQSCKERAIDLNKQDLIYWLESNIAELHMESGENEKAKEILQEVNKLYPEAWYGYKLMAKIYYEEGSLSKSLDIITHVLEYHQSPELSILKHRINQEIGKQPNSIQLDPQIHDLLHDHENGSMYATHVVKELLFGNSEECKLALEIAEHEVQHRSTPETLSLLAYAYFKNQEFNKACSIVFNDLQEVNLKKESQIFVNQITKNNCKQSYGRLH